MFSRFFFKRTRRFTAARSSGEPAEFRSLCDLGAVKSRNTAEDIAVQYSTLSLLPYSVAYNRMEAVRLLGKVLIVFDIYSSLNMKFV
jgi:hypothetical protein